MAGLQAGIEAQCACWRKARCGIPDKKDAPDSKSHGNFRTHHPRTHANDLDRLAREAGNALDDPLEATFRVILGCLVRLKKVMHQPEVIAIHRDEGFEVLLGKRLIEDGATVRPGAGHSRRET